MELPPGSSPVIVRTSGVRERDYDFQAWMTKARVLQGMDPLLKLDDGGDESPIENFESNKGAKMGLVLLRILQERGLNNVVVFFSHKGKYSTASESSVQIQF